MLDLPTGQPSLSHACPASMMYSLEENSSEIPINNNIRG
jgi:hypothetical protein